jgi:hypothetical protein
MPFGHNVHFLRQRELADTQERKDIEEAYLHCLERNRKLQAQLILMRSTPPRERLRDHLLAVVKTMLPPAATQAQMDSEERTSRQVHEISDLQAQVVSLHTRLQRQTTLIERQQMQLLDLHESNSVLQTHLHDPTHAEAVAEISSLRHHLAERTNQNNSLLALLDRERHLNALAEQPVQHNHAFPSVSLDRENRMV